MDTDHPIKSIETKLGKCISRYKDGLSKVLPEEKEQLWSYFINCLIDVRQEDNKIAVNLKTDSLREALEMAFNDGFLNEKHYIQWLDLVDDKDKIEILKRGTALTTFHSNHAVSRILKHFSSSIKVLNNYRNLWKYGKSI